MLLRTSMALQTFKIKIPSLLAIVREINGRYTFNIFSMLITQRNEQDKIRNSKYLKFLSKHFAENGMEKLSANDFLLSRMLKLMLKLLLS